MWDVTSGTVKTIAGIFQEKKRKEISGVVGSYEVTRQAFAFSTSSALLLLGVISLSLGVINLSGVVHVQASSPPLVAITSTRLRMRSFPSMASRS